MIFSDDRFCNRRRPSGAKRKTEKARWRSVWLLASRRWQFFLVSLPMMVSLVSSKMHLSSIILIWSGSYWSSIGVGGAVGGVSSLNLNQSIKKSVLKRKPRPNPLFQKCRPTKGRNKQLARAVPPLHRPPNARRPAAEDPTFCAVPWHPSSLRPKTSTMSPSRFGKNTFARNWT